MTNLPNVTMVIVDCKNYGNAVKAIMKSLEQITPARTIFFTDKEFESSKYDCVKIKPIKSTLEYSEFIMFDLNVHILTSHVLVIQSDGYVLDGSAWTDEFLKYDYIGAPWLYRDNRNVGNGGFSLRSVDLQNILTNDQSIQMAHPEDEVVGRLYRGYLESTYKMKFAPEELAHKFSFELHEPRQSTFGFHGKFHEPFKQIMVIKRSASMGDIIMMEPVMYYYHRMGYRVVLDIPPQFYRLFHHHYFPVQHITEIPNGTYNTVDLDMAYEIKPKQLVLKSYYEMCGITDGVLRNSKLNFPVDETTKMFEKYIVMHIDDTGMNHRNIHGVDWEEVAEDLTEQGYYVIQVGTGNKKCGIKFRTATKDLLMYLVGGADYFIGVDSGPSHIAVGLGVKSVIMFGSVNPAFRYADMTDIRIIQNNCPFEKDGCYHSVVSEVGVDCEVDKELPPCVSYSTESMISNINYQLKSFK